MAKTNSKLETRLRKEVIKGRRINRKANSEIKSKKESSTRPLKQKNQLDCPAFKAHLGQIHDDVDQLLDTYQFLLHAIEILQLHSNLDPSDLCGFAAIKTHLRDEGERVLDSIGQASG